MSGCDMTSALYRKGKIKSLKVLQEEGMENIVKVFDSPNSTKEEITNAACNYILRLYGAKKNRKSSVDYRYKAIVGSAMKNSLHLASLPPTPKLYNSMHFAVFTEFKVAR